MTAKRGLTFGAFDLFHVGHLNLLKNAKELVDTLIVCVSTDEYIEKHKGHSPTVEFEDRVAIVEAIRYVTSVDRQGLYFSKRDAVEKYSPDLLIVGDDWTPETYTGAALGVEVAYVPYTRRTSSTAIKKKIVELGKSNFKR